MQCVDCFILFLVISITNYVRFINGDELSSPTPLYTGPQTTATLDGYETTSSSTNQITTVTSPVSMCPSNVACSLLGGDCIDCQFNTSCVYGTEETATCTAKTGVNCTGAATFERIYQCRYCYQLDELDYRCNQSTTCMISSSRKYYPPRSRYTALCIVKDEMLCLGRRRFYKERDCNWTSGYKWSMAFILSITLGGFGVDRFYLGLWREGIGKLFSFGGLGVWTLVDVILVGVGYVGPADGSLYI